jgi:hypothetical protein
MTFQSAKRLIIKRVTLEIIFLFHSYDVAVTINPLKQPLFKQNDFVNTNLVSTSSLKPFFLLFCWSNNLYLTITLEIQRMEIANLFIIAIFLKKKNGNTKLLKQGAKLH